MALLLTDDQRMIRQSADRFFADAAPVAALRGLRDSRDPLGWSRGLWRDMAAMGFAGVLVPESHGGSGLGLVAAGLIAEAMGRNLSAAPFLSTAVIGATLVVRGGTPAQQRALLPAIAAGAMVLALAADEKPRHAPAQVATRAEPHGNGFRLSGAKPFVVDGWSADRLIVAARTSGAESDAAGISLFLVDPQAPGVRVERRSTVDARNVARVAMDAVAVDGADLIGPLDGGHALLEAALDAGRAGLAAELLGVGGEAFGRTLDYLRVREQFGVPIGSFQALQHRAAHLYCELEMARSAVLAALAALDSGAERAPLLVGVAKARAAAAARLATGEAVQMHGGIGMTDEHDIGLFMKRARAAAEWLGDEIFCADRVGRILGC